MEIIRQSRGSEIQRNQQRIFLCWHTENSTARDILIRDLLSLDAGADCVVSWLEAPDGYIDVVGLEQELYETSAMVLIVSQEYLEQSKTRAPFEYSLAKKIKLPIIPVALEPSLFPQFTEQEGAIHGISLLDDEYRLKLKDQLSNLLASETLIQEINDSAFTGCLFLSYRKKDLALARIFMKSFHDDKNFQSIAIWYDNFLSAGRVFDVEIENSIDNADVFALMATPNITETDNYVLKREYPYAIEHNKCIVAVKIIELDKKKFEESYTKIDFFASLNGMYDAFRQALPAEAIIDNITTERGFLLGLAFLRGVMVEKDVERAIQLLTDSANGGYFRSAELLGKVYYDLLKYESSIYWYKQAAKISEDKNGIENEQTARIYRKIAVTHIEHGDHKSALEWSLKALPIQERLSGSNNLDLAKTLIDICTSYQMIGEVEKVPPLLEKAAYIYDHLTDADQTDVITGYCNIATAYHNNISFAKAMETHLKSISLTEKVLGTEHPLTAYVYTRAGLTYLRIGVTNTACDLFNKALDINKKLLPPNHPEIAAVYELLSNVYDRLQNYKLMIDMLDKAKTIREDFFGESHWITAITYRDIGILFARTGSYEAAKDMLLLSFSALRKTFGMNHPFTLEVYKCLRDLFEKLGTADSDKLWHGN